MGKRMVVIAASSACLWIAGLLFTAGALAATTELECVSNGGYVSEGSGCRFCVGGKFDLAEVGDSGKDKAARVKAERVVSKGSPQAGVEAVTQENR